MELTKRTILALALALAMLCFVGPANAAWVAADGWTFQCTSTTDLNDICVGSGNPYPCCSGSGAGTCACCELPILDAAQIPNAERPQRVASCANGESFFVKIQSYPITAGASWQADMDITLAGVETNRVACFDMSTSVIVLSATEIAVGDADFGNYVELQSDTLTTTAAYSQWMRMYGLPTTGGLAFTPYRGSGGGSCPTPGPFSACQGMPMWVKFTRDDANTGCTADPAGDVVVLGTVFETN